MASMYVVRPKEPETRRHEIQLRASEAREAGNLRKEHRFRQGEMLPLITVPIDYLVYRLENYRTGDGQLSLVANGQVPKGFFAPERREDPSVQQKQHEILVELAKEGSGESIKPIYDELARVEKQTEDLLITADGVVVNGNRRLCAMRELYASKEGYESFANILCAVLPESATPDEILTLEIELQMQPETRLPYSWTAFGRAVRDQQARNKTPAEIAKIMNRDESEIVRAAKMVDAADLYLGEWLGKPDAYEKLDDTEQAFKQIAVKNLTRSETPAIREITRKFDFFVIEQRYTLDDSAYNLINAIEKSPKLFLDTLAAELSVTLPPLQPPQEQQRIAFDDEPAPAERDYRPLLSVIEQSRANAADAEAKVKAVEQVCRIVAEQGRLPGQGGTAVREERTAQPRGCRPTDGKPVHACRDRYGFGRLFRNHRTPARAAAETHGVTAEVACPRSFYPAPAPAHEVSFVATLA